MIMGKGSAGKTTDYGPGDALTRKGLGPVKSTYHGTTDSDNMGMLVGALLGSEIGGTAGAVEGAILGGLLD